MSRCPEALAIVALIAAAGPAAAEGLGLGRPATEAEIAAWNIDVRPDGLGLPPGQGSVSEGEEIFTNRCAMCHGDFGEGVGRWPVLAGGQGSLTRSRPVKTIGSYWPYLSTVFDYVHRAMPFGDPQSLTPDETYALTAYLLYLNDVVTDEDFVLSRGNFIEIHLPNEGNFVEDPRPDTPTLADGALCMQNCSDEVEISMRAAVLDVTPDEDGASGVTVSEDGSVSAGSAEGGGDQKVAATGQAESGTSTSDGAAQAHPELAAAGETVFGKCKACHEVGPEATNRVGPQLNGLIGRTAGGVDGFNYSSAMEAKGQEGLVWSAETIDDFLANPKDFVPGTRMSFAGLDSPEDRAAVAAFLGQFE